MKYILKIAAIVFISIGLTAIPESCKKKPTVPVLTTANVSGITQTTAVTGGNITSDGGAGVTARGVCWGTTQNPTTASPKTTDGKNSGTFVSNITGLNTNTSYYVRAYATNSEGTGYGNQVSFTTSSIASASLTTSPVTTITETSAVSGGDISSDGGSSITARGVCWSTGHNPTTSDNNTSNGTGTGTFTSSMENLQPGTTYYVRAYATNSLNTVYGNELEFITLCTPPSATTGNAANVGETTATLNGTVNASSFSASVTFEYGLTTDYGSLSSAEQSPVNGNINISVNAVVTDLSPNTFYHYRVKAENCGGVIYGDDNTFTTEKTNTITDIDGNNYTIIKIGDQIWMKENLKTTKYNDGSNIPLVTDSAAWSNLASPGYCWYNNDPSAYKDVYGGLYNWRTTDAASNSDKNVCPAGWHVPTDEEWTILEDYLIANGFNYDGTTSGNKIAKSLASTTLWEVSAETGAVGNVDYPSYRDKTGFSALPTGCRDFSGAFHSLGVYCKWWSATEQDASDGWTRFLYFDYVNVTRSDCAKEYGYPVRCLKDQQ